MPFSLQPPCPLPSSIPFSSPRTPIFPSNHEANQQGGLRLFSILPTSVGSSSRGKPPNALGIAKGLGPNNVSDLAIGTEMTVQVEQTNGLTIKNNNNLDKRNCRIRVQDFVDRITAPNNTTGRIEIINMVKRDGGFRAVSDFNDLLVALVNADQPELALETYSNFIRSSFGCLVPDCWTDSIMISCYCKKNEPSEAKRILDRMMDNGFEPDVATFTTLINSFCETGRLKKAFEVLGAMSRIGCEPTIRTYNCLLKGLCYVGRVEEAYELLMHIKKSTPMKPDIYTCTAVMDGFCKVGRSKEAMELLDEALGMGLTPNAVTFNTLFSGYSKEGRPLEGIGLLKHMKQRNCMPDQITYNTLLHGLLKWGEIPEALRIYEETTGRGFEVDERMMNTLLRGLCRKSRTQKELLSDAHQVFERMKKRAVAVYPDTYGLVIEAFCRGCMADEALENLLEMIRVGHSPRIVTFDNVIRALCVEGKVAEALSILLVAYERRKIPSTVSFDVLMNALHWQGKLSGACVYAAALKRGLSPRWKPREC